jgi:hypothetical protein
MPLSISNSKPAPVFYAKVLAGICALVIVTFEIASDYLLKDHSETFARVSRQYADAVRMRPAKPGEPISVQRARVDTLPIDPAALSAGYYQPDEFHLNSEDA